MSDTKKKAEEKNIRIVLSRFISHYRTVFIIILALIFAVLIGVGVYTTVHQNRVEKSAVAADELQGLYEDWQSAAEDEKGELKDQIVDKAEEIVDSYSRLYAAQRAYMVLGQLYYRSEEWQESIGEYEQLVASFPKSYLAPIALMSAAAAYEQTKDYETAISLYARVEEEYSAMFPETPYAVISIGRLYEQLDNNDAAIAAYNRVIDNFSGSNWTNIAYDRIIYLDTVN